MSTPTRRSPLLGAVDSGVGDASGLVVNDGDTGGSMPGSPTSVDERQPLLETADDVRRALGLVRRGPAARPKYTQ